MLLLLLLLEELNGLVELLEHGEDVVLYGCIRHVLRLLLLVLMNFLYLLCKSPKDLLENGWLLLLLLSGLHGLVSEFRHL
jgi:hypothetical protein